ncbi:uncharacterized protein LOC132257411 [Phlebotomus argentipes]|uniref:uncharacterized protein LOC132257411 n=1 Tax=Phlebotomus argentipes TaxID=94469 RepID=UPI0028937984|nr:uncharacterized protein LOC132257411 [Phlebotomus argentipes]
MKVFGQNIPVFALLLAVLAIQCVNCQHKAYNDHKGYKDHKDYKQTHHVQADAKVDTCQAGDYYILSHILGLFTAYAKKYHGFQVTKDCPLDLLSNQYFAHTDGEHVYFFKRSTGTVNVILNQDAMNYYVNSLSPVDVEFCFNEFVGVDGATLSPATATLGENLKVLLVNMLDQRNKYRLFINFNGAVLYPEFLPQHGYYLNSKTSALCDLVDVKDVMEFMHLLDDQSSIVVYLRQLTASLDVGSNQLDYVLPNHDACWKYVFGYLSFVDTLPNELKTLYYEAGLSTKKVDFDKLALVSLTVSGLYTQLKDWLYKLWVDKYTKHGY